MSIDSRYPILLSHLPHWQVRRGQSNWPPIVMLVGAILLLLAVCFGGPQ